jgi:hypothetical protein
MSWSRRRLKPTLAGVSFSWIQRSGSRSSTVHGLLEGISGSELRAVLEHENYHVRNLDPLKAALVQSLSAGLFFLPALDSLCIRYAAARELAADQRAVAVCGRRPLAGALLKVVRGPQWCELEVAAAIGGSKLLDVRVAQLETGRQPRLATPSIMRAMISLLGAALFVITFLTSVSDLGGPAAVQEATGTGVGTANLIGGLSCATPLAGVALVAYWLVARRASRPLSTHTAR